MEFKITDIEKFSADEAKTALERAFALANNIDALEDYKGNKGVFKDFQIKCINSYGDDYSDEFYIDLDEDVDNGAEGLNRHTLYVEVLTAESAEYNEREYMSDNRFTNEERNNYKLGETVQWYSPLGDSGFWYTLK